ncbi:GA-binding protein subunit beta-2 [Cyrtonyx montezumae]|uniref:GA-binding protein subunit beta-2 n=1 Tax=Cyrtonyx montezumae TaxID=9017 RepID=UPI0032DA72E8
MKMSLVDLGKRLLEAARKGEDDEVRTLMASGAPFSTDWLGTSPLHLAAQHGHYSTAEVLLRAGISRDARTKVDRTPLHLAAADGHAHVVDLLIRNGADVNAKDMLKMTALHWAAEHNHWDVVELLVRYGADVYAFSKFDKLPFDIALDKNHPESLVILQEAMQQQVDVHLEEADPAISTMTITLPLVLPAGEVLSLASLISTAETKGSCCVPELCCQASLSIQGREAEMMPFFFCFPFGSYLISQGDAEERVEANPVDPVVQQALSGEGQHVIAILTNAIPLGILEPASLCQFCLATVQDGQPALCFPVITVPAGQAAEETVTGGGGDAGGEKPPAKRLKVEQNGNDVEESKDSVEGEALQQRPGVAQGQPDIIPAVHTAVVSSEDTEGAVLGMEWAVDSAVGTVTS